MATRLKKKNNPAKKTTKPQSKTFAQEKEEKIDWKKFARDERTWKIVGAILLVIGVFLFVSFISYLFTWEEDQDVAKKGLSALFDNTLTARNLLGRLGALVSHFFINYGFGIASFLVCTFFFVVGINLLFRRRVFSIWRNLKYVTVGLLVLSVSMAFLFGKSGFPFGGAVGDMISGKLTGALGTFGTGAVLVLLASGYFIWQFNPSFNWPAKKDGEQQPEDELAVMPETGATTTINDLYGEKKEVKESNTLSSDSPLVINYPDEKPLHDTTAIGLKVIEKDEPVEEQIEKIEQRQPTVETEIVSEMLHSHEEMPDEPEKITPPVKKKEQSLELEIKPVTEKEGEEQLLPENLPPYEPTLDLSHYKYPTLSLLETHGSEKIIQDANELENNKNQIIATLRNYAIEIQKISATVGPTVTLYEIVPA
ncbi:MAG: DNA translocase FtsK 4TM domain-containing protein, partial [Bacteroidota bacterium]